MRILDETDKYMIGHIFEEAYLIEKSNGKEIVLGEFYGDPTAALISKKNEWAIVAGEHLAIWANERITKIEDDNLRWIYALRTNDDNTVEILIDPWSDKSSVWTLDMATLELRKVKDFNNYKDKEHTNKVVW